MGDSLVNRPSNSLANNRIKSLQRFNLIAELNASSNSSVLRLCILISLHLQSSVYILETVLIKKKKKQLAELGKAAFFVRNRLFINKEDSTYKRSIFQ